jgi:hypothetical protein
MPDLSKITKAERIKKIVLIHMWPSDFKAHPDTNSYFKQGLLLKDKITIFTCPLILKDDSFNFF